VTCIAKKKYSDEDRDIHIPTRQQQSSDSIKRPEISAISDIEKLPAFLGDTILDVTPSATPPVCHAVRERRRFPLQQDVQHFFLPDEVAIDLLAQGEREAEEQRVSGGRRVGMGDCSGGAGTAVAEAVG